MALTFLTNRSYSVFLTTSSFTTSLSLLKSTGVFSNLPISNLSTLLFKLSKPFDTFFNLSVSNSSISDFKLAKLDLLAKFDVSKHIAFF